MLDNKFTQYQNRLFSLYFTVQIARWLIPGVAFVTAGYLLSNGLDSNAVSKGQLFEAIGVLGIITCAITTYLLKQKLTTRIWDAYKTLTGSERVDLSTRYHQSLAGPVVLEGAKTSVVQRLFTGSYKNHKTSLQELLVTYEQNGPSDTNAVCEFSYLVLAIELDEAVPHIFIDGRNQNKKQSLKSSNLWSLTQKLDDEQRMRELEGKFGKYFDIYVPHRPEGGVTYQRELDALRVLTPDVMLALRDKGYEFDYELYGSCLYVIHEPDLLTAADLENFVYAADAALTELIPQLTKHAFSIDGSRLTVKKSLFRIDMVMNRLILFSKYFGWFMLCTAIGAGIGNA